MPTFTPMDDGILGPYTCGWPWGRENAAGEKRAAFTLLER